ncbi:MAG: hypothetical protein ACLFQC_06760 [Wenzhouxiangella sp.]
MPSIFTASTDKAQLGSAAVGNDLATGGKIGPVLTARVAEVLMQASLHHRDYAGGD